MGLISAASLTPAFTGAQAAYNVSRRITGRSVQTVWLVPIMLRWSGMWVLFPGDGAERARAVLSVWNSISLPNSRLSPSEANSHPGRRVTWGGEHCSGTGYLAKTGNAAQSGGVIAMCHVHEHIEWLFFLPLFIYFSGSPQLSEKHKHVRENSCLSPRERPCSAVFPNPLDPTQVNLLYNKYLQLFSAAKYLLQNLELHIAYDENILCGFLLLSTKYQLSVLLTFIRHKITVFLGHIAAILRANNYCLILYSYV